MPKLDSKTKLKVVLNIARGPGLPAQQAAWRKFWQKLIAEAKTTEKEMPPNQTVAENAPEERNCSRD